MKRIIIKLIFVLTFALCIYALIESKIVFASQASGITSSLTYSIINKNSGKYLNVNYGVDADGTNVTQFTGDNSKEQKFAVIYGNAIDAYVLSPSFNYDNETLRLLDVYRSGGIHSGCNVDIWVHGDDDAQFWKIYNRGNGYYSIHLRYDENLALTAIGTANGSGAGTGSSSAGNVIVQTYTGADNQLWSFTLAPVYGDFALYDNNKHIDYFTQSSYSAQFDMAVNTWNGYKPNVLRSCFASSTELDCIVYDYNVDDGYLGAAGTNSAPYYNNPYVLFYSGYIRFNSYELSGASSNLKLNVALHELGHVLGLGHRTFEGTTVMKKEGNASNTTPNSIDFWNYGNAYYYW